jgi:heme/copper-type cytochrome/quinol oxidase subunit 4
MIDEAKYAAVYSILMPGLIVELLIAVDRSALGAFAGAAILGIAALQALFIFLVYMHGRFGPRPIKIFAVISLITVLPLFIALLYSVVMPHHGSLP